MDKYGSIGIQEYTGWRNMDNRIWIYIYIYIFIYYTYLFIAIVLCDIKYFSTVFLIPEILTSIYCSFTSLFYSYFLTLKIY